MIYKNTSENEKKGLSIIQKNQYKNEIVLPENATILDWSIVKKGEYLGVKIESLKRWGIIKKDIVYFQNDSLFYLNTVVL